MVKPEIVLPSREDVEKIWDHYATPTHIRQHMRQVNTVAMAIATRLNSAGEHVILPLVDRASLLHDTVRVTDWKTLTFEYFPYTPTSQEIEAWETQRKIFSSSIPHAQVNYEIFREKYPEMAQVIRMHSIGATPHLRTWEEKIVNYADRRVAHDKIVTIKERLDEAQQRYSRIHRTTIEHNPVILKAISQLEEEIFSRINEDPNQLFHQ